MINFLRKWILKLVLEEIKANGCEVGGYKVEVIDGTFTITKEK